MTQEEQLLYEIERRGGSITTYDLMSLHILQYQARLKGLREKLAQKGLTLTEGTPIEGQKRNFLYLLIKPGAQMELLNLNEFQTSRYPGDGSHGFSSVH